MKTRDQWKLKVLIAGMLVIALVVNYRRMGRYENQADASFPRQPSIQNEQKPEPDSVAQSRQADEEAARARNADQAAARARQAAEAEARARQVAADAAAAHAAFLSRYLNTGFARKPGTKMIAIMVASEDGRFHRAVSDALTSHLKNGGTEIVSSFFKPEFISDGLFKDAFNGSVEIPRKLELAAILDGLLLAHQEVKYSTSPELLNVITASMQLEVVISPITGNVESRSWTFTASGAGFKREEARALAEERLIKQITNDTKMSLN